jgi:hypothetical protein
MKIWKALFIKLFFIYFFLLFYTLIKFSRWNFNKNEKHPFFASGRYLRLSPTFEKRKKKEKRKKNKSQLC